MTDCAVLGHIGSFLSGIATVGIVLISCRALTSWRDQRKTEHRMQLAGDLLNNIYSAADGIIAIRSRSRHPQTLEDRKRLSEAADKRERQPFDWKFGPSMIRLEKVEHHLAKAQSSCAILKHFIDENERKLIDESIKKMIGIHDEVDSALFSLNMHHSTDGGMMTYDEIKKQIEIAFGPRTASDDRVSRELQDAVASIARTCGKLVRP